MPTGATASVSPSPCSALPVFYLFFSLFYQSLLRRYVEPLRESCYLMLETVREFALYRLEESGEAEAMRERHSYYFTDRAEATVLYLQWQRDTCASVQLLNAYVYNLRAAVSCASAHSSLEMFLRLAARYNITAH